MDAGLAPPPSGGARGTRAHETPVAYSQGLDQLKKEKENLISKFQNTRLRLEQQLKVRSQAPGRRPPRVIGRPTLAARCPQTADASVETLRQRRSKYMGKLKRAYPPFRKELDEKPAKVHARPGPPSSSVDFPPPMKKWTKASST